MKSRKAIPGGNGRFFLYELGDRQWNIPELRKQLKMVQSRGISFTDFEVAINFPNIGKRSMLLNAHRFPLKEGSDTMIMLTMRDTTVPAMY
jgi:hypothetical protein